MEHLRKRAYVKRRKQEIFRPFLTMLFRKLVKAERAAAQFENISVGSQFVLQVGNDAIKALFAIFLHFQQAGLLENAQMFRHVVFREPQTLCNRVDVKLTTHQQAHDAQAIHFTQRFQHQHAVYGFHEAKTTLPTHCSASVVSVRLLTIPVPQPGRVYFIPDFRVDLHPTVCLARMSGPPFWQQLPESLGHPATSDVLPGSSGKPPQSQERADPIPAPAVFIDATRGGRQNTSI